MMRRGSGFLSDHGNAELLAPLPALSERHMQYVYLKQDTSPPLLRLQLIRKTYFLQRSLAVLLAGSFY
jgi:hypothetical protein